MENGISCNGGYVLVENVGIKHIYVNFFCPYIKSCPLHAPKEKGVIILPLQNLVVTPHFFIYLFSHK